MSDPLDELPHSPDCAWEMSHDHPIFATEDCDCVLSDPLVQPLKAVAREAIRQRDTNAKAYAAKQPKVSAATLAKRDNEVLARIAQGGEDATS